VPGVNETPRRTWPYPADWTVWKLSPGAGEAAAGEVWGTVRATESSAGNLLGTASPVLARLHAKRLRAGKDWLSQPGESAVNIARMGCGRRLARELSAARGSGLPRNEVREHCFMN